eukprot:754678-Pelagomonas_calceolata.AAC.5
MNETVNPKTTACVPDQNWKETAQARLTMASFFFDVHVRRDSFCGRPLFAQMFEDKESQQCICIVFIHLHSSTCIQHSAAHCLDCIYIKPEGRLSV